MNDLDSQTDSLSWVVFSDNDRPECIGEDCNNEAVKRMGPVECCNVRYPYCIHCLKHHVDWLEEDLALGIGMEHVACGGTFYSYVVEDL